MTTFSVVDVVSDTPEWEQERRRSIGASEVAAIMGLSKWSTALDVWKHKQGIDQDFDELLAFTGHASEAIIHQWVEQYSGLGVSLTGGFMARSLDRPHVHASFDRVTDAGDPAQFKTSHFYAGHHWDEGVPVDVRVQVMAEMYVKGTQRALVVVWIGGREFRPFWVPRDDRFINDHMLPAVDEFWQKVLDGVPPEPSTLAEIEDVWPTEAGKTVELSEPAYEVLERITVLNSDIKAQEAERDALKVALAPYTQDAEILQFDGRTVATWKSQKGRASFDRRALEADHPALVAQYTTQGAPFRVLRFVKQKEQSA